MGFWNKNKSENSEKMAEENKNRNAQAGTPAEGENTADNAGDSKQAGETGQKTSGISSYQFAPDVKLRECKYCRVMIPKAAKICPNCKMRLKKRWLRNLLLLLILAALISGGVYWYLYEYQGQMVAVMQISSSADSAAEAEQAAAAETTETNKTAVTDAATETAESMAEAELAAAEQSGEALFETGSIGQTTENAENFEGLLGTVQVPDDTAGNPDMAKTDDGKISAEPEEQAMIRPEVTEEDICGADGPLLDYADKQSVIFHDYFGLFVYDRKAQEISVAVDLEKIGCQYTQGDRACEVLADADGRNVYLHPMKADEMYVLDVKEQILTRQPYTEEALEEKDLFVPQQTKTCVEADPTVFRSAFCAELAKENYLYLESGSGMALDLCYVVEQKDKVKERGYLLRDYRNQEQDAADAEKISGTESDNGKAALDSVEDGSDADNGDAEKMEMPAGAGESEPIDVSAYTEPEFRNLCQKVSYKALLRQQDIYLHTGVTVELTVLKQVDGGLFDDNIYYLCTAQEDGVQRYYIVRDDRKDDDWLILEGDVLRIYGQLFGNCKVPAEMVPSQPTVPALAMSYYELLEE